jgi:hypothetical protein
MNIRQRHELLEPLIRKARSRAIAMMVLAGAICVLEVMSMIVVVMRWRVDQSLNSDGEVPTRSLVTLLTPLGLTILLLLAGALGLWQWSRWQRLRTERDILQMLLDDESDAS